MAKGKTLGSAIDELVSALEELDSDARVTAINAACEYLGIRVNKTSANAPPAHTPTTTPSPPPPPKIVDIKTLKEEKNPKGAIEMACLVAYYLQECAPDADRSDTVSVTDLENYFLQAKFKRSKGIKYTLVNAKNAGYFDSAGGGQYKLNAVGYNLVAHTLPRNKPDS